MSTMPDSPKRWLSYLLPVATIYWIAMFVGTHLPRIELPSGHAIISVDKVLHFSGYFGLAFLLSLRLISAAAARGEAGMHALRSRGYQILLVVAVYAMLDEWTQPLVGRSCELLDWLADILGASAGMLVIATWLAVRSDSHQLAEQRTEDDRQG